MFIALMTFICGADRISQLVIISAQARLCAGALALYSLQSMRPLVDTLIYCVVDSSNSFVIVTELHSHINGTQIDYMRLILWETQGSVVGRLLR